MSTKLDQSLDEILSTQRGRGRGRGARRVSARSTRPPATAAPVGGVKKHTKAPKAGVKGVPTGPSSTVGDSKIVVSGLPKDVNEAQIKEYFVSTVGPIKRAEISYGPNGQSRGIANITFGRIDGANKALKALNGLLVDGKPMKIEILVDASRAPAIPAPKGLSERIAPQKPQPKSAAASKPTVSTAAGAGTRGRGRGGRRGARSSRPAKKTAEELNSDMVDYFNSAADTGAVAAQATANDDAMEDEVL